MKFTRWRLQNFLRRQYYNTTLAKKIETAVNHDVERTLGSITSSGRKNRVQWLCVECWLFVIECGITGSKSVLLASWFSIFFGQGSEIIFLPYQTAFNCVHVLRHRHRLDHCSPLSLSKCQKKTSVHWGVTSEVHILILNATPFILAKKKPFFSTEDEVWSHTLKSTFRSGPDSAFCHSWSSRRIYQPGWIDERSHDHV